jgi:hypothetical protein
MAGRAIRVRAVAAVALAVTIAQLAVAVAARAGTDDARPVSAGVDCGCPTTGAFVAPKTVAPSVKSTGGSTGTSPHGTYTITATASGSYTVLTITRTANSAQVFSTQVPTATSAWGFSPDDDRFSYATLTGTVDSEYLYDLAAGAQVWNGSLDVTGGSAGIAFSPSGNYLLVQSMPTASSVDLAIVDAHSAGQTQHVAWSTSYQFFAGAGAGKDKFGSAADGFSPDGRTFVLSVVTSQTDVTWQFVNLRTRKTSEVLNLSDTSATTLISPCGDVIALAEQSAPTTLTLTTWTTSDLARSSHGDYALGAITMTATADTLQAKVGEASYDIDANTAGDQCPAPQLASMYVDRTSVYGGKENLTATVVLSDPAPDGGLPVTVSSSDDDIASWGTPTVTVPAGAAQASSTVTTSEPTDDTDVTLTAAAGSLHASIAITVTGKPHIAHFAFDPDHVEGGATAVAQIALNDPANVFDGAVNFRVDVSDPAMAVVPEPNGYPRVKPVDQTTTLELRTRPVTEQTTVTVTLTPMNGTAAAVADLTLTPTSAGDIASLGGGLPGNYSQRVDADHPDRPALSAQLYGNQLGVDPDGNIWTTTTWDGPTLVEITTDGTAHFVQTLPDGYWVITSTGVAYAVTPGYGRGPHTLSARAADGTLTQIATGLDSPTGVATDEAGDLYIADGGLTQVIKVDPIGTQTVFAGTGTQGHTGNGGPAIDADISPMSVAADRHGNVYIGESKALPLAGTDGTGGCGVRKVDSNGIITGLVDYSGLCGDGGDGRDAAHAEIGAPIIAVDRFGNLFIADMSDDGLNNTGNRVRVVTPDGTITALAGTGAPGYDGDGGPAGASRLERPVGLGFTPDDGLVILAGDGDTYLIGPNNNGVIREVVGAVVDRGSAPVPAPTNTTLSASRAALVYGSEATETLTAAVTASSAATPSGTITISDAGRTVCATTLPAAACTLRATELSAGTHTLIAHYPGDAAAFVASQSAPLAVTVSRETGSARLTLAHAITRYGAEHTDTVRVQLAPNATGAVRIVSSRSSSPATSTVCIASVHNAIATCRPSDHQLAAGQYRLTAHYAGSANIAPAVSAQARLTVQRAGTTTALTLSRHAVQHGHERGLELRVAVHAGNAGPPPGRIRVLAGSRLLCTARLANGHGMCRPSASRLGTGHYRLHARYPTTENFAGSISNKPELRVTH